MSMWGRGQPSWAYAHCRCHALSQVKFAKHWFWGKWMGPAAQDVSKLVPHPVPFIPPVPFVPWHRTLALSVVSPAPLQIIQRDEARIASRKAGVLEGAVPYQAAPPKEAALPSVTVAHV